MDPAVFRHVAWMHAAEGFGSGTVQGSVDVTCERSRLQTV